jgi:chromosome segregation ATPase
MTTQKRHRVGNHRAMLLFAATLCAAIAATPLTAQEVPGTLLPEDAAALMRISAEMQSMEAAALSDHAEYSAALERSKADDEALAAHRAAFEAKRDADAQYKQVKGRIHELTQQKNAADEAMGLAVSQRRSAETQVAAMRTVLNTAQPQIARHQRDVERYQKSYDHLLNDVNDNVGVNRSGSRANSLAAMQAKIDAAQTQLTEWQGKATEAESRMREVQGQSESLTQQIATARTSQQGAMRELLTHNATMQQLDRSWENKYQSDPRTAELLAASEASAKQLQAVRVSALASLKSEASYAQLVQQRDAIEKRRVR